MIIGLSGYARSGKDEAARGLCELGFKRYAFADVLRDFLYVLNPIIQPRYHNAFDPIVSAERLQWVVDKVGWDGYKSTPWGPEIRELLQRLGTEGGRELVHDRIWIDATLRRSGTHRVVIPDVRFPNEADAIRDEGGMVIRINRPGVGPANSHSSETALDDYPFDAVVNNNKTVAYLHDEVYRLAFHFTLAK